MNVPEITRADYDAFVRDTVRERWMENLSGYIRDLEERLSKSREREEDAYQSGYAAGLSERDRKGGQGT